MVVRRLARAATRGLTRISLRSPRAPRPSRKRRKRAPRPRPSTSHQSPLTSIRKPARRLIGARTDPRLGELLSKCSSRVVGEVLSNCSSRVVGALRRSSFAESGRLRFGDGDACLGRPRGVRDPSGHDRLRRQLRQSARALPALSWRASSERPSALSSAALACSARKQGRPLERAMTDAVPGMWRGALGALLRLPRLPGKARAPFARRRTEDCGRRAVPLDIGPKATRVGCTRLGVSRSDRPRRRPERGCCARSSQVLGCVIAG
jgi:hypothetical protein